MNLFICGSRSITDRKWIISEIENCITEKQFHNVTILEGGARGVDLVAKEYAVKNNISLDEYLPDYDKYHNKACHQRNEAMAKDCDFMLDLWDGESGGSLHDILMAEKYCKPYKVRIYSSRLYEEAVQNVLDNHREIFQSSDDLRVVLPKYKTAVYQYFLKDVFEPWWEEGHNSGSCFWIYPVRQTNDKSPESYSNCYCYFEEQISIEEDVVYYYLYHQFLHRYFNKSISYLCRVQNYDSEDEIEFDWYDHNLYTYETVRKIAEEMKRFAKEVDLGKCVSEFYNTLANRLILMMERQPNWDYITFEGP